MSETKITKQMIKAIKTKQRALKMTDDAYRALISDRYWQNSCTALTETEGHDLLDYLDSLGRGIEGFRKGAVRPYRQKQYESSMKGFREEICALAQQRFGEGWEKPLNKLCLAVAYIDHYKFLDYAKATAVKDALVKLEARGPYQRKVSL